MSYNTQELIKEALGEGFSAAGALNLSAVVFMPEIRQMCNTEQCRKFNKNWKCPPACGSIEKAAEKAARYSYGLIVQTIGHTEDDFDFETITGTGDLHKKNFAALVKKLKARYDDILPMGAGTCELCQTCSYPDAPCRHPEDAISSMEAYGLWVSRVCELSDIAYYNGPLTITYTSCYLLK